MYPCTTRRTARYFYPRPPRGGRRFNQLKRNSSHFNFYPRPPRGGRHGMITLSFLLAKFLPTPSARRATDLLLQVKTCIIISTHALREEGDAKPSGASGGCRRISTHALREEGDRLMPVLPEMVADFYPRPPRGGRPAVGETYAIMGIFLPTPSARRATAQPQLCCVHHRISTHALREEGDVQGRCRSPARSPISTHALREEGD